MPFAPIVVDVSPAESPPALRRSLLEACGQAMKTTQCVEAGAVAGEPSIVATVRWTGSEHVRLEITLRGANQTVERDIDFGQRDALEERWRTTGLVIGTLASVLSRNELPSTGELPEPPEEPSPPKAERPEAPVEPSVVPSRTDPRDVLLRAPHRTRVAPTKTDVMVDLSALVAPGISGGSMRAGGEIGVRLRPPGAPWEPSAAVSYSESLSDTAGASLRTFDGFLGFAPAGNLGGPFSAIARGEGFIRWLEASATSNGSLGPTSQSRVLGGARIGVDGVVRVADPLSFFVGAAGIFAAGSTDVTIHGRNVGSIPALSYALRAGMSAEF